MQIRKKNGTRQVDLKGSILALECLERDPKGPPSPWIAQLTVTHQPGLYVKPQEALGRLIGRTLQLGRNVRIARRGFVLRGGPDSPAAE